MRILEKLENETQPAKLNKLFAKRNLGTASVLTLML
jgi:hypothetical protein